jgi:PadR family transcriptional regulator, regulatory protein AphA
MPTIKLEFILFGALLQQPQTGYELQRFMETTGRFLRTNTAMTQVYRSLRGMERRGWLTYQVEPRLGAQDAKRYRVTPDGRSTYLGWLREPYQPSELRDESFLAQLRFRAQYVGRGAALEVLDREIAFRGEQIRRDRDRDRTESYDRDAPIEVELTSALMEWATGSLPFDDVPALLQPSDPTDRADLTTEEVS